MKVMNMYKHSRNKRTNFKEIKIMISGYGAVAKELVRLLSKQNNSAETYGATFLLTGIIGSEGMIYEENGINLSQLLQCEKGSAGLRSYSETKGIPVTSACLNGDVLIECSPTDIQTGGSALGYIIEAIQENMNVVSVSKGALVHSFASIMAAAEERQVQIKYSGATAAALPTLDIGEMSLAGSTVTKVEGILNGTSNFILTAMQNELVSYEQALSIAKEKGIAESNPVLDIEGTDSACKLLLIANKIFCTQYTLQHIQIEGITQLARSKMIEIEGQKEKMKLLCTAEKKGDSVSMKVRPVSIKQDHPLYHVEGVEKGIVFYTEEMGRICCTGGASSPTGAAAAALKDLINLYRSC